MGDDFDSPTVQNQQQRTNNQSFQHKLFLRQRHLARAAEIGDKVAELAKPEFKARMAVKLAVAGAFHTDFMAPAVSALSAALADTEVKAPRIPVVSNVDAAAHADPAVIKDLLAKQVTSPVLFEDSVANLLGAGFAQGYELGPGKVIAGIFKRIDKTASVENVVV